MLAVLGLAPTSLAATSASATTPEFRLSIKHDGVHVSAGDETLRYSSLWDGGSNETAKVTIAQNGTTLVENLTGEGDQAWSVARNGTYNLTHTTYTNGAVAAVLNATVVVTGKDVPFPEGAVTVTGWSGPYDGQPHSISVTTTGIENPAITYALDANGPFGATNPTFTTVTNQTVWCVIAAAGYITETNSASVVITEGEIGGGGGEEPGPGEIPEGGLSKFDATYVYDGAGHTINTQSLYAVTLAGATPSFSFSLESNGVYQTAPFVYTNVGEYVCWYKIETPNYKPFVHQAKLTILEKTYEDCCLTFTSTNAFTIASRREYSYQDYNVGEIVSPWDGKIEVCTTGNTWNEWDGSEIAAQGINGSYKICFRGCANTIITGNFSYRWCIVGSFVRCSGDIESLLDYRVRALGAHPDTGDHCFTELFDNCEALCEPPTLSAVVLSPYCYYGMFYDCKNLAFAPELPAKELSTCCYCRMFWGCEALTEIPNLPATNMQYQCYRKMFEACRGIRFYEDGEGEYWRLPSGVTLDSVRDWRGEHYTWDGRYGATEAMFLGCDIDFSGG